LHVLLPPCRPSWAADLGCCVGTSRVSLLANPAEPEEAGQPCSRRHFSLASCLSICAGKSTLMNLLAGRLHAFEANRLFPHPVFIPFLSNLCRQVHADEPAGRRPHAHRGRAAALAQAARGPLRTGKSRAAVWAEVRFESTACWAARPSARIQECKAAATKCAEAAVMPLPADVSPYFCWACLSSQHFVDALRMDKTSPAVRLTTLP